MELHIHCSVILLLIAKSQHERLCHLTFCSKPPEFFQ